MVTCEPPGGAGVLASVKLESEDMSATTGILKTEAAAAEDLVLGAGVAQETGESTGGAGDIGVGRVGVRGCV